MNRALIGMLTAFALASCGGDDSTTVKNKPPSDTPPASGLPSDLPPPASDLPPVSTNPVIEPPLNTISSAYFRDQDGQLGKISGVIPLTVNGELDIVSRKVDSVWVYWGDENGNKYGDAWLKTDVTATYSLFIPLNSAMPSGASSLLLVTSNHLGQSTEITRIPFHDFVANNTLSGRGGNEIDSWEYGVDREKIAIQRDQKGLCSFDNGLVQVVNMNNMKDEYWESNKSNIAGNTTNDSRFPAYTFSCADEPIHSSDKIEDEIGVWTYSTLNDAMFYGTLVYDYFVKYLGEPPLQDKLRIRVHYGEQSDQSAYWDGAYANFGDAYPLFYSMASLDSIAHEIGHGVLNRISALNFFETEVSIDARTIHEAFGDISGVVAKYEFTGELDNWVHGEENVGYTRLLSQIKTEPGAIESFFDYDDAGDNFYLRIGMFTYPFYLLSNSWGIESTYKVYISAAKTCWHPMTTLTEAAECIKQQAGILGFSENDVVQAFKTVKIKLFEEGTLSHFTVEQIKLNAVFTDNSFTTNSVSQWLWDFGDGNTSNEQNPSHHYSQLGTYSVTLTVTDQNKEHDVLMRTIDVTDQYCDIRTIPSDTKIADVVIADTNIGYVSDQSDYTDQVLELSGSENNTLSIVGNTAVTQRSTTWRAWIDLNDNGVFGDDPEELVLASTSLQGLPYGYEGALNVTSLANDGSPKYMRVVGDYVVISPCDTRLGQAFDVKVNW